MFLTYLITLYNNIQNFDVTSLAFSVITLILSYLSITIKMNLDISGTLKLATYLNFKNSNFIKESFYIDFLQKKLLDNFFYKTFVLSTQIYNLMIVNTLTIKYVVHFILNISSSNYNFFTNNISTSLLVILYYFLICVNSFIVIFLFC